jgi:hypothetical protein
MRMGVACYIYICACAGLVGEVCGGHGELLVAARPLLQVWAGCRRGGSVRLWGLAVPARYSWCVSLALTHLCVPEASLPAHLAGVAAGLLRAYVVQPGVAAGWV